MIEQIRSLLQHLPIRISTAGTWVHIEIDTAEALAAFPESPPTSTSWSLAPSEAAPAVAQTTTEAVPETARWWEVTTPVDPSPLVLALRSHIGGSPTITSEQRIRLAYQRGRQGAAIKRGEISYFSGPRCELRNRCYVVLQGGRDSDTEPFFTWTFAVHQAAVRPEPTREFSIRAISHGFASSSEATAFCLGAGLPSLPTEQ